MSETKLLDIYEAGELTVLGFGRVKNLDQLSVTECRDEITAVIKRHNTLVLAFDLTGVKLTPSGFLGLMASLRQVFRVEVHLFNPNSDIREMLEITKLDQILYMHEVEVEAA